MTVIQVWQLYILVSYIKLKICPFKSSIYIVKLLINIYIIFMLLWSENDTMAI